MTEGTPQAPDLWDTSEIRASITQVQSKLQSWPKSNSDPDRFQNLNLLANVKSGDVGSDVIAVSFGGIVLPDAYEKYGYWISGLFITDRSSVFDCRLIANNDDLRMCHNIFFLDLQKDLELRIAKMGYDIDSLVIFPVYGYEITVSSDTEAR